MAAENKTKPTEAGVESFLNGVLDEQRRQDAFTILQMMKEGTRLEQKRRGSSIVGFGRYHYKYESGREGDSILTGFSPRAQNFAFYGMNPNDELLQKLGKY